MNLLPLTPNEMAYRKKHGMVSYGYFREHETDLFSDANR